jgi:predicted nucleic-acid-binding protein
MPDFYRLQSSPNSPWVLEGSYKFSKQDLVRIFEMLLRSRELVVEQKEKVSQALHLYASGNAGFVDYLIERTAPAAGCTDTFIFDQKAAASAGMRLLK